MQHIFEELDYQKTPLGDISLRKRSEPRLDNILIYEVKLGDEFLMSSLFVEAEEQLSALGLQRLKLNGHKDDLNIVVGGLGLGYTALTAVNDKSVARLRTIDVMQAVIDWHRQGLLPVGNELAVNPNSELIHGDFFAIATDDHLGILEATKVHAILLDIDHSPSHWLNQGNSGFYNQSSLQKMSGKIVEGGVFGLWSNERPDPQFTELLNSVFSHTEEHVVSFPNPYSGGESINSVYISTV
jgi:spermidine synthase